MAVALTLKGIKKAYGSHEVLCGADLLLETGSRLGIVGANGCGKSTLLNVISGEENADEGVCALGKGLTMGYLHQETVGKSDLSIWNELMTVFEPVLRKEAQMREIEAQMGEVHDRDPAAYARLAERYDQLTRSYENQGGYRYKSDLNGTLNGLGFSSDRYDQNVATLSGGERTRLALAKLLLQKPDVLLLDEPTNHLDMASVEWLEGTLKSYPGTILIVSHDRYFLDVLTDHMAEFEQGRLVVYGCGYTQYAARSQARRAQQQKEYELYTAEVARQEKIIQQYRAFNREKSIRAAESREKALQRMEVVEKPVYERPVAFSFSEPSPTGQDVLTVVDLEKRFDGRKVVNGVSFSMKAGDRVAIIGRNGVGKSTLLKMLAGVLPSDGGAYVFGARVRPGYYDQQQDTLNDEATVLDEVWQMQPRLGQAQVRSLLGSFQFRGDEVFQPISTLSGGERGRVALCKLLLTKCNFLLLDEPTNHLDMGTRQALENALDDFTGSLLVVSHDRYFINRVANRVLVLDEEGVTGYLGNYTAYQEQRARAQAGEAEPAPAVNKTEKREQGRRQRLERERKKQLRLAAQQAEAQVSKLESEMDELAGRMSAQQLPPQEALEAGRQYAALEAQLEEAMANWEARQAAWEAENVPENA